MTFEIVLTIIVVITMMIILMLEKFDPLIVFFLAVTIFLVTDIISTDEAIAGFANKGVLTIAMIFIITAAARNSGALDFLASSVLKIKDENEPHLLRLFLPTTLLSAFVNNTPVVATIASFFTEWGRKNKVVLSKYLIPISFAGIFGGVCTLIGTSTNLVVSGLLEQFGYKPLGMFELTPIGLPLAFLGILYLYFFSKYLLPERESSYEKMEKEYKEYLLEMYVKSNSELIGKKIEDAELRNLEGVYLTGIIRKNEVISPVKPSNVIVAGDILTFAGEIDKIDDLLEIKGLEIRPESHEYFNLLSEGRASFFEAVVSLNSPLVDKTPKEINFRHQYNAVILAVNRQGERIVKKIGNIRFKPGDTLFLIADDNFTKQWERGKDFFYTTRREEKIKPDKKSSIIVGLVFFAMVLLAALNIKSLLFMGFIGVSIIILSKTFSFNKLKSAIDLKILVMIALAFGVGKAIENSGTAHFLATQIYSMVKALPVFMIMIIIYLFVMVITEVVTNNSAAIIMLPIALRVGNLTGVEAHTMALLVAIAASASFLTPIGYQTNLIVYGLGDYKFSDFFKVGLPLSLTFMVVTVTILSIFY